MLTAKPGEFKGLGVVIPKEAKEQADETKQMYRVMFIHLQQLSDQADDKGKDMLDKAQEQLQHSLNWAIESMAR